MEDEFDMAYRGVIPARLGWAIPKIKKEEDIYSDDDEHATILKTEGARREMEKRMAKRKQQQSVITIVMTLVLGIRKMRAELRRRVDAWKELVTSFATI